MNQKLDTIIQNQTLLLAYAKKESKTMSAHSDALKALDAKMDQVEADEALTEQQTSQILSELAALRAQLGNTEPDDTAEIQAITARMTALDTRLQALRQGEVDADTSATVAPNPQPPAQNVPVDGANPPADTPREVAQANTTVDAANAAGVDTSQIAEPLKTDGNI